MKPAPVALFVYNRPDHTRRTLGALAANLGFAETEITIYSDAARTAADERGVKAVRELIRDYRGASSIRIIEQRENQGLANSIIHGVSEACESHGRVIALEDDLVTSRHFLRFMNDALAKYEHHDQVMHISGYTYPTRPCASRSTFFLRLPMCWGWGTWSRAWQYFRKDSSEILGEKIIDTLDFGGTHDFSRQYDLNRTGAIDTWFIFWYLTLVRRGGLSLFPSQSLVRNIGLDASGTHRTKSAKFEVSVSDTDVPVVELPISEDAKIIQSHQRYFRSIAPSKLKLVLTRLQNILR